MDKIKKKREEDEEARLQEALHEFQSSFQESDRHAGPKTFVRSESVLNAPEKGTVTQMAPTLYKPTPLPVKSSRPPLTVEQSKRIAAEAAKKIMEQASKNVVPVNRPPKPGMKKVTEKPKISNLEIFKEELKQVQALRQERKGLRQELQEKLGVDSETIDRIAPSLDNPYLDAGSSAYEDDPSTTNLYLANLPSDVSMEDIYATFGTFGPLASAKILYPRPDDSNERKRDFHSGFVAFMVREDSERALCAMDGERMRGMDMRVTWARPVTIPPVPFFVPIALRELAMPDPPSGLVFNARPRPEDLKEFLAKHNDLPRLNAPLPDNAELRRDYNKMVYNSVVRVVIPTERAIEFLVREGPQFEAVLMAREKANLVYRFLFEYSHPTHVYYRWKLYSILQGDDRVHWRLDRFKMFDENGPWWEPPPHSLIEGGMPSQLYNTAYVSNRKKEPSRASRHLKRSRRSSSDSEGEGRHKADGTRSSESKRWRGVLEDDERDKLEDIIRNLVPEKDTIGDATVWCLEHAECSKEIVQCLLESLSIKETPLHKKIARFYLCSDILANCGVRLRDVFYFRQHFGEVLIQLFVSLNETLEAIESRIKAEQFRSRVMLCFRLWEDNSIYPTDILIQMQNIFLVLAKPNEDGSEKADDDLDGEPIGEDMGTEDDIDGVPITESEAAKLAPEEAAAIHESRFTTSSWSQVDVEIEQRQQPPTKWERFTGISKWEAPDIASTSALKTPPDQEKRESRGEAGPAVSPPETREQEEERRRLLRDIEVKVVKLQDELESHSYPPKRIEEEISIYRKKLVATMEEELAKFSSSRRAAAAHASFQSNERGSSNGHEKERKSHEEGRHKSSSKDERKRSRSRERHSRHDDRERNRDHRRRDRSTERRRR